LFLIVSGFLLICGSRRSYDEESYMETTYARTRPNQGYASQPYNSNPVKPLPGANQNYGRAEYI
jgi:hypothetical protein